MKLFSRIAFAAVVALLMAACSGSETTYQYKTQYLPVQLVGSEKWSILDVNNGEVVAKDAFVNAPSPIVAGMFYVVNEDGSYDYYDVSAPTTPVAGHFGSVTSFSDDGVAVCSRVGGSLCVIDRKGQVVKELPKEVSQCSMFSRGMAAFQNDNGSWGYINTSGDTIVPANYSSANMFLYNDYAMVIDENQPNDSTVSFTVINKNGKVMFTANSSEYQPVQPYFINGVLPVVKGDTLVCLNEEGKEVANPIDDSDKVEKAGYADFSRTPSGDYIVIKDKKTGMVDKNNQPLIPIEHDNLIDINGERLIAVDGDTYHIIDRNGKAVGDVKFSNAHVSEDNPFATRGFIDTDLAAVALMSLFEENSACGANANTTLMDMNGMLGTDARMYAGSNTLVMPQGPYIIQYVFDREVSSANADSTSASFNYDAKVDRVIISLNLNHCPANTEPAIVNKVESRLGTKGFVFARDGIFCSDYLTALTLGYDKGVMNLIYYMHFNESVPQVKNKRS
ncbi:MAG: WG repeat-containing protein [Muribaculaceae bacterium]|nr:WG repeat-containing protein [Muribaculaceae bacterium]